MEVQLQKKEVAYTAAQGKIELLTSEAQAKVRAGNVFTVLDSFTWHFMIL